MGFAKVIWPVSGMRSPLLPLTRTSVQPTYPSQKAFLDQVQPEAPPVLLPCPVQPGVLYHLRATFSKSLTSPGLAFLISKTGRIIPALQSHRCVNEMRKWFLQYKVLCTPEGDLTQPFAQTHLCITLRGSGSVCLSSSLLWPSLGPVSLLCSVRHSPTSPHSDPPSPSILSARAPQRQSLANVLQQREPGLNPRSAPC